MINDIKKRFPDEDIDFETHFASLEVRECIICEGSRTCNLYDVPNDNTQITCPMGFQKLLYSCIPTSLPAAADFLLKNYSVQGPIR